MIKNSSILEVNKKNLIKNYNFFKKLKKDIIVAPTIKANAYGLGVKKIFNLLVKNKCKHFFVATLEEGLEINNKNKNIYIYILNGLQNYKIEKFSDNNLIPIINSISELKKVYKSNIIYGLHIDTGINRLGIDHKNLPKFVFKSKNIKTVISHLASADEKKNEYNEIQIQRFRELINNFKNKKIIFSLSNSNGTTLGKSYLFNMIRPGIGLYGGNNNNKNLKRNIKSVVKLIAKVIQIKKINADEYIGYNQTFKTNKDIKIAIIGIGYADGVPRRLSNKGTVFYKNTKFKVIGRISMDSLTIDISKNKHNLKVGNYIELINYKFDIEKFANECGTISNEVITSIGSRVKIEYV